MNIPISELMQILPKLLLYGDGDANDLIGDRGFVELNALTIAQYTKVEI